MSQLFQKQIEFDEARGDPGRATWAGGTFVRVALERGIERVAPRTRSGVRTPPRGGSSETARENASAAASASDIWEAGVLTYRAPEGIELGRRVMVPLGRGGKSVRGVVVETGGQELARGIPLGRVKAIARDEGPGIPGPLIELAKWMASYYACPIGMVLATMIPAAVKKNIGVRSVMLVDLDAGAFARAKASEKKPTPALAGALAKLEAIDGAAWPMAPEKLAVALGQKTLRIVNRLVETGVLKRIEHDEIHARGGAPIGDSVEQDERLLHEDDAPPGGFDAEEESPFTRDADRARAHELELTPAQAGIVAGFKGALGSFSVHLLRGVTGSGKTEVYLRFIEHLLESDKDATALVLVPEISLTPQMGGRFNERFERFGVAVLHSGLSPSQRHKQWQRARLGASEGGARVVVGARSAVFAPLRNIGAIIVDEEHASDYKQDQLPRYHGRDVAIKRAQLENCPVILGSATPSLESWANARPSSAARTAGAEPAPAKYRLWELTERVGGAKLPRVEVVDLAHERKLMDMRRKAAGAHGFTPTDATAPRPLAPSGFSRMVELGEMIGPTLEEAMAETFRMRGQVVLLLNRRGYAGYIACADSTCGWVLRCDDCDAGLVFHKVPGKGAPTRDAEGHMLTPAQTYPNARVVRCHHCLAQQVMPSKCPNCNKGLIWLGLGTQRVEEEVREKFGHLFADDAGKGRFGSWAVRVDGDTMRSGRDYFDVLSRFGKGDIRVLMGTQMIAKGLDFPNVRLVGVINADTALGLADFRASERTFQLVSQVAGRAGRTAAAPGRVIVQTMEPESPAIEFSSRHDFVGFAEQELEVRRRSGLPPVTKMARIVIRDPVFEQAMAHATTVARALHEAAERLHEGGHGRIRIVGPMECPIARIAGQFRVGIELTAARRGLIQSALAHARGQALLKSDVRTAVDVDPIALV